MPFGFNLHPMHGGNGYPTAVGGTGQQGNPAYGWATPSVPSQGNPNPAGSMHPHTYSNNTIPYGNTGHPNARTQTMHLQATGMLPQHTLHSSGMPGVSGSHHGMQTTSNSSQGGGVGVYQCPQCGSQFDRLGRFEAHMNVHSDIRPYVCDGSCGSNDW